MRASKGSLRWSKNIKKKRIRFQKKNGFCVWRNLMRRKIRSEQSVKKFGKKFDTYPCENTCFFLSCSFFWLVGTWKLQKKAEALFACCQKLRMGPTRLDTVRYCRNRLNRLSKNNYRFGYFIIQIYSNNPYYFCFLYMIPRFYDDKHPMLQRHVCRVGHYTLNRSKREQTYFATFSSWLQICSSQTFLREF